LPAKGLDNTWGYYHKYPDAKFLQAVGMNDLQVTSPSNISDDGVQGNNVSNQAAFPASSNIATNDNILLIDNDAQEKSDDEKQANSNE
jgi:hypothetical protein